MSTANPKVTKNTKKTTSKTKQQFIRLNLDLALEKMLQEYEQRYTLLSRSDIIRMLLSEIYWDDKRQNRTRFLTFLENLPKSDQKLSEAEIFKIVYGKEE